MKAELITRFRDVSTGGDGIEMVVWRVSEPVPSSSHGYKYRLVYVVAGERVIGFDNERAKATIAMWAARNARIVLSILTA